MTDERHKSSSGESVARPTARDVPNVRSESLSELAPQAQRPAQLPRDPSYEAELAQAGLAVLRDPDRRDPSTKPGGGRGHTAAGQAPESTTPESPGARPRPPVAAGQSPEPPSSASRAVASGTLLSVGAVDPRGKTERTLETPRMFFSQEGGAEAYFKPGKIPAVTVHQTLETETVKLSDSVDPRRAKTLPRIDRAQLAKVADVAEAQSAAPMVLAGPSGAADSPTPEAERWDEAALADDPASLPSNYDGQIHASLSAFRDPAEPSYNSFDDAPTRAEPIAGRRALPLPELELAGPDPSTVPTQRDLPHHRADSLEPLAPQAAPSQRASVPEAAEPESEGPRAMAASIAAEEPERRPVWINYAAFLAALLVAIVVGLFLTRESEQANTPPATPRDAARTEPPASPAPVPAPSPVSPPPAAEPEAPLAEPPAKPPAAAAPAATPPPAKKPASLPASTPVPSPKPASKPARETIF
jgi:hypothetical protein